MARIIPFTTERKQGERITIGVRPAPRGKDSRVALFDAFVDGQRMCRSRQPFLDACRELIKRGAAPDAVAEMRHEATGTLSLRARIGVAARWVVRDLSRTAISGLPALRGRGGADAAE
jgi:hypothetical protein